MSSSRRDFLKTTAIAGTGLALSRNALAASLHPDPLHPAATAALEAPTHAAATHTTEAFTKGIGLYPGAPSQNFAPTLIPDTSGAYRNLALLRPAFHSSAYDYNLTAQLVTDGIVSTDLPTWLTTLVNGSIVSKEYREGLVNHFAASAIDVPGPQPSIELHLGGDTVPEIDRITLFAAVPNTVSPADLIFTLYTSADGHTWSKSATARGSAPLPPENFPPDLAAGSHLLRIALPLAQPGRIHFYRVDFTHAHDATQKGLLWRIGDVSFYNGAQRIEIGGPYHFTSAWKSAGLDQEWVYVDLGAHATFDKVTLHWIARAAEGKLQISDDAATWHDLHPLPTTDALLDEIKLAAPTHARYLRVLMTRPATPNGYILSELEVFGRGGYTIKPHSAPLPSTIGQSLAGGRWRIQRAASAPDLTGESLSTVGFKDADWLPATVPGTALTSYVNAGAIPDPNYGQNQLHISDSFFYSDFWYRTEFPSPATPEGEIAWLNFDGINWKAEVYLNGDRLGDIAGGFTRGNFNITSKLSTSKPNALAVRILKNATPGSCKQKTWQTTGKNGGALGADNPTYHASIGWDWIPTIRGRNTGIWADVSLTHTGAVTLEDPLVTSKLPLPDITSAEVSLELFAVNHTATSVTGTLHGTFGELTFEHPVTLAPNERRAIQLKPLHIAAPKLWWPTGYGNPHLYDVALRFEAEGRTHHTAAFKAGIRQMTADENGGNLHLYINGRRFIARGGNWGFGENNLLYRAREYDIAVRYHREMNFTMIRNWVGQIGDDAFFEACDRHGIVVWQDFWLANPWDGPIPDDNTLFLNNARDFISRIRRHASIGLYCGRNEWFPPAPLDKGIPALLSELHPGIHYIGSSADGPVSGHGPYRALLPPFYFEHADPKLHSELGAPNIPPYDSLDLMMPKSAQWPQALDWGLHDFTLEGAQGGTTFLSMIADNYGGATNARDWTTLAQFVNYDTYRAMFEAQSKYRMGLLLWMSHPCWPSFVWQTYDYFFEPTAAYFACKKASEPVHIQWNAFADTLEVVNYNAGDLTALTATLEIFNLDGSSQLKKSAALSSREDSTVTVMPIEYPATLSAVHFLRLTLTQHGKVLSQNLYHRGTVKDDYHALRALAKAHVTAQTTTARQQDRWLLTATLTNTSPTPAVFVRLKAIRQTTKDRILPAIYSDNYITLMPNETRTLTIDLAHADTRNEQPALTLEGFNL
ncbi:twin-arginine translocation signal domain-containing protein [Granulicella sp. 5B5]|uniref:glycosyl hydrolase 2 galactose-binding domain-containing protein n=1 Tax=Granulicella sp. 5B5 TaxID=1617967 RepID=UPI0015F4701C|nr:discoidin domain-containing protein [Granulicella sp. 5B5]QMV19094.1 twin-arginine translocation signal domain-containing protein [Granulicella sp. 5B5]